MIRLTGFRDHRRVRLYHSPGRHTLWHASVAFGQATVRGHGYASADDALTWAADVPSGLSLGDTAELLDVSIVWLDTLWHAGALHCMVTPEVVLVPDAERERIRKLAALTY